MTEKKSVSLQTLSGRAVLHATRNLYITHRRAYLISIDIEWNEGKELKKL